MRAPECGLHVTEVVIQVSSVGIHAPARWNIQHCSPVQSERQQKDEPIVNTGVLLVPETRNLLQVGESKRTSWSPSSTRMIMALSRLSDTRNELG